MVRDGRAGIPNPSRHLRLFAMSNFTPILVFRLEPKSYNPLPTLMTTIYSNLHVFYGKVLEDLTVVYVPDGLVVPDLGRQ